MEIQKAIWKESTYTYTNKNLGSIIILQDACTDQIGQERKNIRSKQEYLEESRRIQDSNTEILYLICPEIKVLTFSASVGYMVYN